MQDAHSRRTLLITTGLAIAVALLPSCRRAPEEQPAPVPTASVAEEPLATLELPQQNSEIGISLNAAPAGLAVTYNGEHWLELTDLKANSLRYTFIEDVPDSPGISPTNINDFESLVSSYPDGKILDTGVIDTALGEANWSNGTYSQDGEIVDDLAMFIAHPSGSGILILRSTGPAGVASVEDRLAVMQALLANVS